jgi:hypothetical protein
MHSYMQALQCVAMAHLHRQLQRHLNTAVSVVDLSLAVDLTNVSHYYNIYKYKHLIWSIALHNVTRQITLGLSFNFPSFFGA